jgi:DNA-binding SARP family transcriptional activator
VRFALLGPLSVNDGAGPVKVTGKLRRTLLAALLLDAGTPVSADRLAALLWGPDAAAGTSAALHTQLMRLRQALGDEDRVRAAPPGYLIHVEPGELDLQVFTEEYAAGRRKLADKAWTEASRHFGAALDLWRGRPLADIPALADHLRIRELEETHLQALQGRIEAELNLGRHHEVLAELGALTEQHPRHEAFRGQLMLALHRAGQRDEAAAAYDEYEKSLLDELGLEPGVELRELHEAVVRGDPALALPPKPNPNPSSNPDAPRQLPADTRTFTGRTAELAELVADAAQTSGALVISALDGLGGIGKTALAVHAAHRVADRFRDGQLFIDLRGYSPGADPVRPADALAYLLRSLGVPPRAVPEGLPERAALYRERLADSRTLILLDNAADSEQVRPLLPGSPGCLVLITSRNRLAGIDDARALNLGTLGEREAVSLLAKVAGPRRGLGDSPEVRELARLCGHIPLALRIVAARLHHHDALTVEQLIAELGDEDRRLGRLTDGERDLSSVFGSSFEALSAPERRMLRLLGTAAGPDIDAYAAANLAGVDLATAGHLLDALVDRNLLIQQRADRYTLHDLVRSYTRTLIDHAEGEASAARERLLGYYQHAGWKAARYQSAMDWRAQSFPEPSGPTPELPDLAASLAWFRAEQANLLTALSARSTPPERRIDLTAALAGYLLLDGPWPQAAHLHEAAARDARELGEPLASANALCNLSQILRQIGPGRFEQAAESAEQALRIYRELGHRRGEADALYRMGQLSYARGRPADAMAEHRLALPIARELGDRLAEALIRHALAQCGDLLSEREEARLQIGVAVEIYRELDRPQQEAFGLSTLTHLEISAGELGAAADNCRRGLAIGREYGHRQVEAGALTNLARIHGMTGEHEQAHTEFRGALAIYEELGYQTGVTMVLAFLGPARTAAGDLRGAIGYLERGYVGLEAKGGHLYTQVELMRELGFARYLAGDAEGLALVERALEMYRGPLDDPQGLAATLVRLGTVALDQDEPAMALDRFGEALRLILDGDMLIDQAHALDGTARCHERLADPARARENLSAAVRLYRRMGTFELAEAEERLAALGG